MARETAEMFVYAWVSDSGNLTEGVELSSYPKGGENWLPVTVDAEGKPAKVVVSFDVPDGWNKNWQAKALAKIEATMAEERKAFQARVFELQQMQEKLMALEHNPS